MSPENPIQVVILAAGFGTRLHNELGKLPKGLAEADGKPLVTRLVEDLRANGFSQIALITNALFYQQYETWNNNLLPPVTLVNDGKQNPDERLGAIGDLLLYLDQLGTDTDILICPSDTYIAGSLKEYFDQIRENPDQFLTVVRKMSKDEIQGRLGCAVLSEDQNQIISFEEKPSDPKSEYASIPFYYLPAAYIGLIREYVRNGGSLDAPGNLIRILLEKNIPVQAFVLRAQTLDVGTPQDLNTLRNI